MKKWIFMLLLAGSIQGVYAQKTEKKDKFNPNTPLFEELTDVKKKTDKFNLYLNMQGSFDAHFQNGFQEGDFNMHQLRIEALHDDIDGLRIGVAVLVVHEIDAVAHQLAVERFRTGKVHLRAGVALVEVHTGRHAGGEHVLGLAGEAEAAQTRDIIRPCAGGIICEVYVLLAELRQVVHQLDRAFVYVIAKIERTVHVKQKKLYVLQVFFHSFSP